MQGIIDIGLAILLFFFVFSSPVIAYRLLEQKYNEQDNSLRTPTTKAKYDSIYANIDYYKPKALYNTSLFLARRLSLAFLIVYIDSVAVQILVSDCCSTLLLAYYLRVMPMADKLSNFVQIMNECVILVCTWLILQFTLYVPDAEVRHEQAFYFLYVALSNIIFNVLIFLFIIVKRIYMAIKSYVTKQKI